MVNIFIKPKIKQFLICLLTIAIMFNSASMTALAIHGFGDGGGASGGGKPSGKWLDMEYALQGYRMYIIDVNGRLASDECWDFIFQDNGTVNYGLTSGNTRYGTFSKDNIKRCKTSGLYELCGSFGSQPMTPVTPEKINGIRYGLGFHFKEWMLRSKGGKISYDWYTHQYTSDKDEYSHVGNLLYNRSVFHVKDITGVSTWKPEVVKDGYLVSALDAIKTGNYFLVVEPMLATYMAIAPGSYQTKRRFDTYYNFAMEWRGTEPFGWYETPLGSLFPVCMTTPLDGDVSYTITSAATGQQTSILLAKKPIIRAEYTVSQVRSALASKQGLALHLYGADGSMPNVLRTSTYDEPLQDTPGPAPDDSSLFKDPKDKTDPKKYANIVKFYVEYENGTPIYKDSFTRTPTPLIIDIEDEQSWKVKDWYVSDTYKPATGESPVYEDYKSSMSNTQQGTKPGTITVTPDPNKETTLYVLLVKDSDTPDTKVIGDWILNESQLTRHEHTTNTDAGNDAFSNPVNVSYGDISGFHKTHHPGCDHSEDDYNCVDCYYELADANITVKLKSMAKDNGLISVIDNNTWGEKWIHNSIGDSRSGESAETSGVTGFSWDFISHRSKKDPTSIYTGLIKPVGNDVNKAEQNLLTMGFTSGTSKSGSRIANGQIQKSLVLQFEKDSSSDYKTNSVGDYCGSAGKTDQADVSNYSIEGSLIINTYAGLQKTKDQTDANTQDYISLPWYGSGNFNETLGVMVDNSKKFSFTPYIKMRYDNIADSNTVTYVNGKYERTMKAYDYAEVAWQSKGIGNLKLTSNQWSTHKTAYEVVKKWNCVLPGGAIFSLNTQGTEQVVAVRTYQTILKGNGLTQAEYTAAVPDALKEQSALDNHNETVESVIKGFDTLHVQQWVDTNKDAEDAFSGIKVNLGSDISKLKNGSNKASTDNKYYFLDDSNGDSAGASEGDLDAEIISQDTHYYTFYSDDKGDIYMMKDFTTATKILSQTDTIDKLNNGEAKSIDLRTYALTNFVASIERNTGNDRDAAWVTNGHWYNEVFNGVTVAVQTTKLKIGFHNPSLRNSILDPKLIPKRESKDNAYQKMFSFQFKMSDTSLAYGKKNQIGTFYNKPLYMKDMDKLFISEKFYIPDTTVQDLGR